MRAETVLKRWNHSFSGSSVASIHSPLPRPSFTDADLLFAPIPVVVNG
jgi:hypothetical protein